MLDQTPENTGKALWRINPCQKRFTTSSTRPQRHPSQRPHCHTSTEATHNDKTVKAFVKDFEPRPSATGYHDNSTKLTGEKSIVVDNSTKLTGEKSFVNDFEPRPNVSVYHDDAGLKEEKSFIKDFEPRPMSQFTTMMLV